MRYGLILANDISQPDKSLELTREVIPYVDGVKLGLALIVRGGVSIIKETKREAEGKTVIVDLKVGDIGFWDKKEGRWSGTNSKIVEAIAAVGADYVTCHCIVGVSSIMECIDVAHSLGLKVLAIPHMTHEGAELSFSHPLNVEYAVKTLKDLALHVEIEELQRCKTLSEALLVLSQRLGADGFIGPANKPEVLRRYREFTSKEIFGPGIGRQASGGLTLKEQMETFYKICGERSAVIVGSAIYAAPNPVKAAKTVKAWRDEALKDLGVVYAK
ncbi:MAG: orotidine-5'-phosphate decarboxylase [Candidatus Nezhaarchaeales archaeon]